MDNPSNRAGAGVVLAGLALPIEDGESVREIAEVARARDTTEVRDRRATGLDGLEYHLVGLSVDPLYRHADSPTLASHDRRGLERRDVGSMEDLADVDIAQSSNDSLI